MAACHDPGDVMADLQPFVPTPRVDGIVKIHPTIPSYIPANPVLFLVITIPIHP